MNTNVPFWLANLLGMGSRTPRGLASRDGAASTHMLATQPVDSWAAVLGQVEQMPAAPATPASTAFTAQTPEPQPAQAELPSVAAAA